MANSNSIKEIPKLESERLILRELSENDIDDIFEYASDPEVSIFLPWNTHISIDESKDFLKMSHKSFQTTDNIDWGIELKSESKLIGAISIRKWNDDNRCGDIGYVLSRKYWGKGITTEALRSVIKFGFEKLNANRLEAHCDENNTASYRVMEKVGMKYEGTLREKVLVKGKFINIRFYSILRREFTDR